MYKENRDRPRKVGTRPHKRSPREQNHFETWHNDFNYPSQRHSPLVWYLTFPILVSGSEREMKAVFCETPTRRFVVQMGKKQPKLSKGFREIRRFTVKCKAGCEAVIQKFDKPRDRKNQIRLDKDGRIDGQLEKIIGDKNNVKIRVVENSVKDKYDVRNTHLDGFQQDKFQRDAPKRDAPKRDAPKGEKNVESPKQQPICLLNQSENAVTDIFEYYKSHLKCTSNIPMAFMKVSIMMKFMARSLPQFSFKLSHEEYEEISINIMETRIEQFSDFINELGAKCINPLSIRYDLSNEKQTYCIFHGGILNLLSKLSDKDKKTNTVLINELIEREQYVYSSVSAIASASRRDGFAKKVETWTRATCNMTEKDEVKFAEITSAIFSS